MSYFTRLLALVIFIMIITIMALSIISFTLVYERRERGLCKIFGLNEVELQKTQAKFIKMLRPDPEPRVSYDEWEKQQYEKSLLVQDKAKEKVGGIEMQRSATSAKLQSMMRGVLKEEEQGKMAEMPKSRTSAKLQSMMRGVLEEEDRKDL